MKKGNNIYGIIFGAKNALAVEKFLKIAWDTNAVNGAANFDLDEDSKKNQLDMFQGKLLTKVEAFNNDVIEKIKSAGTLTNVELHQYACDKGHTVKQMSDILKQLKQQKLVMYEGASPKISYTAIKKEPAITIKWVAK